MTIGVFLAALLTWHLIGTWLWVRAFHVGYLDGRIIDDAALKDEMLPLYRSMMLYVELWPWALLRQRKTTPRPTLGNRAAFVLHLAAGVWLFVELAVFVVLIAVWSS